MKLIANAFLTIYFLALIFLVEANGEILNGNKVKILKNINPHSEENPRKPDDILVPLPDICPACPFPPKQKYLSN